MIDDGEYDGDDGGDTAEHEAEDTTSRSDVEESLIKLKHDRGDPDPRRSDRGYLKGRQDSRSGGNYEGLTKYHDEASKNGTSIHAALKDYSEVETDLRTDFVSGIAKLAARLGYNPQQAIAAAYQHVHGQQGNAYTQQASTRVQMSNISRDIDAFASDPKNKYFQHVRQDMAALVQRGYAHDIPNRPPIAWRLVTTRNCGYNPRSTRPTPDAIATWLANSNSILTEVTTNENVDQ